MRALTDASLIDAMRAGVPEAWAEFDARFRPLLERYATRVGIPRWEWSVCITEVLDDEALRLVERAEQLPQYPTAYLVRAVRSRFLELKRASLRRDHRYAQAAASDTKLLMSEHARRSSDPPRIAEERAEDRTPATHFARTLSAHLSTEEQQMLAWVAEGVPQRMIAEWLGISREAAKKRIARLCRRLRAAAPDVAALLPSADRREIDRLLRRASAPMNSHSGASDDG